MGIADNHVAHFEDPTRTLVFDNGFELCNQIKQNVLTSHIPVILLTAKVGEENEIPGFKTGADAYIIKPFHTEKLKQGSSNS